MNFLCNSSFDLSDWPDWSQAGGLGGETGGVAGGVAGLGSFNWPYDQATQQQLAGLSPDIQAQFQNGEFPL